MQARNSFPQRHKNQEGTKRGTPGILKSIVDEASRNRSKTIGLNQAKIIHTSRVSHQPKGVSIKPILVLTLLLVTLCQCSAGPEATGYVDTSPVPTSAPTRTPTFTPTTIQTDTLTPTPTSTASLTPKVTPTKTKANTPTATQLSITNGECIPLNALKEVGVVISITDGVTIVVEIDNVEYTVRYIGIDAPEPSDGELGIAASNANIDLVLGKEVTLFRDVSDNDSFNSFLRYVVVESTFVNEYLVRIGMASAISYSPDVACDITFQDAQSEAVNSQAGMWSAAYFDPGSHDISPTTVSLCNCSIDYDCGDFSSHSAAQACFESCGGSKSNDWSALDRDGDGYACESLP